MGLDKLKDSTLIKSKNFILLFLSIISMGSVLLKAFSKPLEFENKIESIGKQVNIIVDKYVPIVESNMIKIAVINTQYENISKRLEQIDRKIK